MIHYQKGKKLNFMKGYVTRETYMTDLGLFACYVFTCILFIQLDR